MSLSAGERLGPYEILSMLGKGGMGEVYRARDTRLGRDVAIKVSAQQFSERFEREARAVAALNHPNICTLYDIGPNYLVMELVEGQNLSDRLRAGAIPLEESLSFARQISDALEAAHEKGIVHRDLKPANIKIKTDGMVKVLDFGLAKMPPTAADATESSVTMTMAATEAGMILGTAGYMSPEQARGMPVDKRADIWAFGVVLYEMVTGDRLHKGDTVSDTLAAVLREEPDWNKVPAKFQRLLRRCLEKDSKKRLRDIGDAMPLLEDAPVTAEPAASSRLPWVVAAVLGIAALGLAFVYFRQKPAAPPEVLRFQIRLPDKVTFTAGGSFALSPDGRHLAFSALAPDSPPRVWIQDMDALEAHQLSNTFTGNNPPPFFWSPDSRFVVYSENSPKLKKVDVSTGLAKDICDKPGPPIGGSWNNDGVIIFGSNTSGLWRVPATGGVATPLTKLDPARYEREHELPSFLPDGKHFLYLRLSTVPAQSGIFTGSLDDPPDGQSKNRLIASSFGAYFVRSGAASRGWLLFMRDGSLMAQTFDPDKLELSGEATPIAEQVGSAFETAYFSASPNALVYKTANPGRMLQLTRFDGQGKILGEVGEPGNIVNTRLSPDGTRVVFRKDAPTGTDLWLLELTRDTTARFTFGPGTAMFPVWSPDGTEIVFSSNRDGVFSLYRKPANGSKEEELLLRTKENIGPFSWSRDGRFLLYDSSPEPTFVKRDIWVLPMQGDRKPFPFLQTRFDEGLGSFSPDGRWVAYLSDETGRSEVYIRPFKESAGGAETGGKWIISRDGANQAPPKWRDDGKQIVYIDFKGVLWAVDLDTGSAIQARTPRQLFQLPAGFNTPAVSGDLKQFLIPVPVEQKVPQAFTLMLNWTSLLKPR
jgi:eukaryotic-like serine/threonine-protein kinase